MTLRNTWPMLISECARRGLVARWALSCINMESIHRVLALLFPIAGMYGGSAGRCRTLLRIALRNFILQNFAASSSKKNPCALEAQSVKRLWRRMRRTYEKLGKKIPLPGAKLTIDELLALFDEYEDAEAIEVIRKKVEAEVS